MQTTVVHPPHRPHGSARATTGTQRGRHRWLLFLRGNPMDTAGKLPHVACKNTQSAIVACVRIARRAHRVIFMKMAALAEQRA